MSDNVTKFKDIINILSENNREDLIDFIESLLEELIAEDEEEEESTESTVEEEFEVGITEEGFHYLK
jgi:hypothetical protein